MSGGNLIDARTGVRCDRQVAQLYGPKGLQTRSVFENEPVSSRGSSGEDDPASSTDPFTAGRDRTGASRLVGSSGKVASRARAVPDAIPLSPRAGLDKPFEQRCKFAGAMKILRVPLHPEAEAARRILNCLDHVV